MSEQKTFTPWEEQKTYGFWSFRPNTMKGHEITDDITFDTGMGIFTGSVRKNKFGKMMTNDDGSYQLTGSLDTPFVGFRLTGEMSWRRDQGCLNFHCKKQTKTSSIKAGNLTITFNGAGGSFKPKVHQARVHYGGKGKSKVESRM